VYSSKNLDALSRASEGFFAVSVDQIAALEINLPKFPFPVVFKTHRCINR
jgi:hypothetical protein